MVPSVTTGEAFKTQELYHSGPWESLDEYAMESLVSLPALGRHAAGVLEPYNRSDANPIEVVTARGHITIHGT